jgi:MoaA/NifB/PqqE/SkfB family radical SAM enzyme
MTRNSGQAPRKLVGIANAPRQASILHISWMLHNLCNQHCSYCPPFNHEGTHGWPKYDDAAGFLDRVFAHYTHEFRHVSFTGGEPTLWPELPKLCAYLKERRCEVGITSNGANTLEFWRAYSDYFNTIALSYHPEYARNAHFLAVVPIAAERADVGVRLMMPPQKALWDRGLAFAEAIKTATVASKVFVEFVPLQLELGRESRLLDYEPWQKEFFSKTPSFHVFPAGQDTRSPIKPDVNVWDVEVVYDDGEREKLFLSDFASPEKTNFSGWECRVGLDQLFIGHDGSVFRAGCSQGGSLGRFTDPALAFPVRPIVCGRDTCPCGTDIMTTKWDKRPPPFRLSALLSPAYLAGRLREIRSPREFLGRVFNVFRYVYGRVEWAYYQLEARLESVYYRLHGVVHYLDCRLEAACQELKGESRLRAVKFREFLFRRREFYGLGNLPGRAEASFADLKAVCRSALLNSAPLRVPEDLVIDARLRASRLLHAWRARRPASVADMVPNPASPMETHPPCRIHLSWNIHIECNYDCSYCWFHDHWQEFKAGNRYLPAADWKRHWERFNARYGPAKVDIAGGEPFTYPGFLDILETVGKNNVVLISTNLSWGVERFIARIDPSRVQISASFHPAYVDPRVFLDKIVRLRRAGFHASASLVAYPTYLHRLLEVVDLFARRGVHLDVQPFRGLWKGRVYPDSYTPAVKSLMERLMSGRHVRESYPGYPEETLTNRFDTSPLAIEYQLGRKSTLGVRCNAGVLYGRLQSDGAVTRCAQGGFVGDFFDEGFRMGETAEPCPFRFCDCINEVVHIEGAPRGPAPAGAV